MASLIVSFGAGSFDPSNHRHKCLAATHAFRMYDSLRHKDDIQLAELPPPKPTLKPWFHGQQHAVISSKRTPATNHNCRSAKKRGARTVGNSSVTRHSAPLGIIIGSSHPFT